MSQQIDARASGSGELFPSDPSGLPEAIEATVRRLVDGDVLNVRITPVAKRLGDATVRMLAYNDSIPGPLVKVAQHSEVVVNVVNDGDLDATVHWHGLRLDNRYDGVPYETQAPIPVGGSFTYRVRFPDAGLYWYHPHIREDYAQEMGLYGAILVAPSEQDYWPPVHREVVLILDDILLANGRVVPFHRTETTHAAMGRFGNLLLVNGEPDLSVSVAAGEVVRLYLVNAASTRVFNVRLPGAPMKLIGGDSGRYEREQFVEEVLLAPSERAVLDVHFDHPAVLTLEHLTPDRTYSLATVAVTDEQPVALLRPGFEELRVDPELAVERQRLASALSAEPDKILSLVAEMDDLPDPADGAGPLVYTCPMHPEIVSNEPGRCPKCGMKLVPTTQPTDRADTARERHVASHAHSPVDGIEWEDNMPEVNAMTTSANMRWKLVDQHTGAANAEIDWTFTVGDRVKIRLVNEMDSDHPMHHPIHFHGAGRFLVLSRDGVVERNLVWKDTVLVRTGQTVDILFDVTNPGLWMAHCHISEHLQSGMMFSFRVVER